MAIHNRQFGVGIIGTGIMGQRMLAALLQHPRFRVTALWDPDAAVLQAVQRNAAGARAMPGMAELVNDDSLDLVYIASPPAAHLQAVRATLAAGRACLCEKPLAADRAEAQTLRQLVARAALPFAVNFPLASAAASRQLLQVVGSGELGQIRSATINLRFARWPREWQSGASAWLAGPAQGGFTREVLSHFVFLSERLFGPAEVFDVDLTRPPGRAETTLRARLQHQGVSVMIDAAVAGEIADHNRFEISGSQASVALASWTRLDYRGQLGERSDPTPDTLDGVAAMLDGSIDHGLASADEAASVVRIIETMLDQ